MNVTLHNLSPVVCGHHNHSLHRQVGEVEDIGAAVPEGAAVDVQHHREGLTWGSLNPGRNGRRVGSSHRDKILHEKSRDSY